MHGLTAAPARTARGTASRAKRRTLLRTRRDIAVVADATPPVAALGDVLIASPATVRWRGVGCELTVAFFQVAGLLLFSVGPYVSLQAVAQSPALQSGLQARVRAAASRAAKAAPGITAARAAARARRPWFYGPIRPRWLPPALSPPPWLVSPPHLTGTLPGDFGFDPLGLGRDAARLAAYADLELLHGRWAMLGVLGALAPETLQSLGLASYAESVWWRVGAAKLSGDDLDYFGIPGLHVAGGAGVAVIAACQLALMAGPEQARAAGVASLQPLGIFLPGTASYPGGWLFDPLGLSRDAGGYEANRVAEVKHGRLAMTAAVALAAQAVATGGGPVENLLALVAKS